MVWTVMSICMVVDSSTAVDNNGVDLNTFLFESWIVWICFTDRGMDKGKVKICFHIRQFSPTDVKIS